MSDSAGQDPKGQPTPLNPDNNANGERPKFKLRRDTPEGAAAPAEPAAPAATPAPAAAAPAAEEPAAAAEGEEEGSDVEGSDEEGEEAVEGDAAAAAPPAKPERKGPLWTTLKVLFVLFIIYFGYRFGFGPLISAAQGKKAVVVVKNSTDNEYFCRLGWRMTTMDLFPKAPAVFELNVGWPGEHQGLKVVPKVDGKGQAKSLSVPVRPGGVTLVNLDQGTTFYIYQPQTIAAEKIVKVDEVLAAVATLADPLAAEDALASMRELGAKANTMGSINDEIIDLAKYNPQAAQVYYEPRKDLATLPVLAVDAFQMNVANGYLKYNAANPKVVEGDVRSASAEATITLAPGVEFKLPANAGAHLNQEANGTLWVRVNGQNNCKVSTGGREYTGNWNYEAHKGLNDDKWLCRWAFNGISGSQGQDHWEMNVAYAQGKLGTYNTKEVKIPVYVPPAQLEGATPTAPKIKKPKTTAPAP